jgi:hypothetical protein
MPLILRLRKLEKTIRSVRANLYFCNMTTKRRRRLNSLLCPECGSIGTMRQILYGMPDPEVFDFEKYAVGGCCINGDGSDPDIQCRSCEWEGFRKDLS